jgi:hypothetical protein
MSHLALRRIMIRMLHDPGFAAAVYADATGALAGIDVAAAEIAWLTREPRAAWRTDADRPLRVIAALAEEYPAAVALATEHAAGFVRSREFHAAVQERGSLALAFGAYLMRASDRAARAVACLEQAIAAVRRAPRVPTPSATGWLRLTPRAALRTVPEGTLAFLERMRDGHDGGRLGAAEETVLAELPPESDDVGLELVEPGLAAILRRAADAECARDSLLAAARAEGADPGEDAEIVDRLVADHLLL